MSKVSDYDVYMIFPDAEFRRGDYFLACHYAVQLRNKVKDIDKRISLLNFEKYKIIALLKIAKELGVSE